MNQKEFNDLKKKLMLPGWTEDLHHNLEELDPDDAKKVVESMTKPEIYIKVNNRKFQEDYIADYLEFLWDISERAYWSHIIIMLNPKVGILWSDNMDHFNKMCTIEIPSDVFKAVLDFAILYDDDSDVIGCVIKAQVDRFGRLEEIKNYILNLNENKQVSANNRILDMIKSKCVYSFYKY